MNDASAGALLFRDVPHFLDADGIDLRIPVLVQVEFSDQLLGQRSAGAFREDRDLCANIDSRFEVRLSVSAFLSMPLSPVRTPTTRVVLDQQLGAGKSRKDIDAALFHLLAEPARKFVERNNVVAVVLKGSGNDGQAKFAVLRQEENVIFLDRILDRRAASPSSPASAR